jgi:uncharacterized repeat protein (TIGR01451 family)
VTYIFTGAQLAGLTAPAGWTVIDATTWTDTVMLNGGLVPRSLATPPLPAGGYQFQASYSGDGNYTRATSAVEPLTVSAASPMISTTPNPTTVTLGGRLQDVANLTGGFAPTGSITFNLYAPGVNPTVGPGAYTETVTGVNGNGTYHTTVGFVPNATGTWHWVATYNGDSNNNSASSGPLDEPVTIPQQADLVVTKMVDNSAPPVGMVVHFTVLVRNNGPDTATNVVLGDQLPPGLTFVGASPSQGSYDPTTGLWFVGTLAPGATATLVIAALVTVSPLVNSAGVAHSDQFDPDLSNNTDTAAVIPPSLPDLLPTIVGKLDLLGSNLVGGTPDLLPDALFINGLYHDVLGRVADQAGLDGWVMALQSGATRQAVASAFWQSPEHRGMQVDEFYLGLLHRPADAAGRAGWVSRLLAGASETQVEAGFLTSAEYLAQHQGAPLYLTGLYADVLRRAPAPAELAGWAQVLQAGGTQAVVVGLLTSPEGATDAVQTLYRQALRRPADPVGLASFAPLLQAGAPLEAVADAVFGSPEYFNLPH